MAPSAVPPRPPAPRPWYATGSGRLTLAAVLWSVFAIAYKLTHLPVQPPTPPNRPIEVLDADYVSSDTCRSCHPGNYASWHASFHRTMTQPATPGNVAVDLDGLELSYDGTDYRVHRRDQAYFVRTKPAGQPDSALGTPLEIVMTTGSHNLQIYWLETGDRTEGRTLGQFPFGYIIAEKMWAPMVNTFLVPPGPAAVYTKGDWNNGCINCHVTQGRSRFVAGSTFDSKVSEFGISCEACHSGGREHIARNRDPLRRYKLHLFGPTGDDTIANPARMDGPTASLACGQCHSIWAFHNAAASVTWNKENGKYRPGDKEMDLRWIVQPHGTDHPEARQELRETDPHFFGDRFWPDGMVRVTGRELNGVLASPCNEGGKFSCLSCHEMHPDRTDAATLDQWRRQDQMKPGMLSDQACLQCHADLKNRLSAHTHHAAASEGSRCYNCHMPHTTYGLLRSIRSHQITSPTVRESLDHGRPNACNLCHLDQTLEWTADRLHEWYGHDRPTLSADDRRLAASTQWLLKGDAGQRMLMVWHMGWAPAQKASGIDWLYPFLIFQLNDPYAAVRFGAWKALQSLPGFSGHPYDFSVDDAEQKAEVARAYQKWWHGLRRPGGVYPPQTVLEANGMFNQSTFDRLLDQRNNRKIYLAE